MNDLQIDYFLAAARNLSFSGAAQELYVSQPAVSRQVQTLEEELGCPLFVRMNKGISLTQNGEMFYHFFENYRMQLQDLKMRARLSLENKNRVIHLGVMTDSDISQILAPVLTEFRQKYEDVKIEVNSYEPGQALRALKADQEDLVLTIEPKILQSEGIESEVITNIRRVLMYHRSQEKTVGAHPVPEDFRDQEFLTISDGDFDYVNDMIKSFCKPYGFVPKVQSVRSTDAMVLGVQCNLGVAISDIWCRALHNEDFGYIPLDTYHPVSLVWKQGSDETVLDFIELMRKHIRGEYQ